MKDDPIVIVSSARTPMGGFQGDLQGMTAWQLGAAAIRATVERSGLPAENVQDVLMGCVLPAGQGQAPARQAALSAGLTRATTCTTVNKMCGSGMQTVIMAHDQLLAGSADIVVAGGMESMSNAPYLLDRARGGYRMGHGRVLDHMFLDGLEDSFDKGRLMGTFAEECADTFGFSREEQDGYALESLRRAQSAIAEGRFAEEIVTLEVTQGKQQRQIRDDEQPPKAMPEKIPSLKPAFREGRHGDRGQFQFDLRRRRCAAADAPLGGRALGSAAASGDPRSRGLRRCAESVHHRADRGDPQADGAHRLGRRGGRSVRDQRGLRRGCHGRHARAGPDHAKVNVNGGACALGHPIGASGARILVTLLSALRACGLRRGVAAICIGGGEATAMAVELV